MDMDFKVAEVTLQYKPTCKKQGKVMSSEEAYKILFPTFKEEQLNIENMQRCFISTKQVKLSHITLFQRVEFLRLPLM